MIILVNLNDYLGGGETLMVRMAEYLQKGSRQFYLICAENSYIRDDLEKKCINNIITVSNAIVDYYYNDNKERVALIKFLNSKLPENEECSFITFCMRDLYTISQLTKTRKKSKVVHLVLHYQENLYICQSLKDKIIKKLFGKELYSRREQIEFNNSLFNKLCENDAIIPMSDLMVKFWTKEFGINLSYDKVVALPTYDFSDKKPTILNNNHKVVFIGRIVDFKIPGLCVMLNFINKHKEYSLTVIGNGDKALIDKYIKKNNIDTSRIEFIGQVDYSKLGDVIKQHSIGYAMGTSVIEICRYGLPAIMALSAPTHQLFKRDICGGLYAGCVRGNVGDNLFAGESEDAQPLLESVMEELEKDYEKSAEVCYEYIKNNYDFTRNIEKYLSIIDNARITDFSDVIIPKASKLRHIVRKLFK
ncbi:glycosyltransferase [Bacteroides heparinolyticus]|uniref:glycosyltransferase n=1 Tax=Prevotella heparinolytica TaxID=28113 RepID=UPI0023F31301|nr:glycosyltransferase [Bacteroides heparinolyticus]